jgi:HlyD family secretion protein
MSKESKTKESKTKESKTKESKTKEVKPKKVKPKEVKPKDVKPKEPEQHEVVFLIKNKLAWKVRVKTGIQDNDYIEIISGLTNKQEVICGPYSAVSKSLKQGSKIKIVRKEDLYKVEK